MCSLKQTSAHGAFSLIELLISMALFSVVLLMATGTLLVVIDANAKAQTTQDAMTNLTLALDSMTREIRTGSGYYCTSAAAGKPGEGRTIQNDCTSGNTALWIMEGGSSLTAGSGSSRIGYRFTTSGSRGVLQRAIGNGAWTDVTSSNVNVTGGYFWVTNSLLTDGRQPSVTVYLTGSAGSLDATDSTFTLQTTISKRIIDL